MLNRGWHPTKTDQVLEALREQIPELNQYANYMLNFERDGESIGFVITPNHLGQSSVIAIQEHK